MAKERAPKCPKCKGVAMSIIGISTKAIEGNDVEKEVTTTWQCRQCHRRNEKTEKQKK